MKKSYSSDMTMDSHPPESGNHSNTTADDTLPPPGSDAGRVRLVIATAVIALLLAVFGLYHRAAEKTNHVALADSKKPVSVEKSQAGKFQPVRSYVGTIEPWNTAKVGPQFISAYVSTVLFRPGAAVRRGEVLATLDCRNASAASREIAAKAKALEERQSAVEHESERVKEMAEGNFASKNEAEQLAAKAASDKAEVESLRASLVSRSLEVDDCILRAPFNAEVSERYVDPGAYVRPGNPILGLIDRSMVRVVGDAPESDFAVVAPSTDVDIEVQAGGVKKTAKIARRAPSADPTTRTVHFELDVPNTEPGDKLKHEPDKHPLPTGTTARLTIAFGTPQPATKIPLRSAVLRGEKAAIFVVEGDVAKRQEVPVVGEQGGTLFVDPKLPEGKAVVVEGRALLDDNDKVTVKEAK